MGQLVATTVLQYPPFDCKHKKYPIHCLSCVKSIQSKFSARPNFTFLEPCTCAAGPTRLTHLGLSSLLSDPPSPKLFLLISFLCCFNLQNQCSPP
ncbi:hypothetical protein CMV_012277 [Castanea mollissima]|uniref:Uncharacterized protein n=1 Tax=Castanea mollissima TaxID=60419 RepID=A0A8J4R9S6_9ROSI|nr:hypothetical protein CMV_012277 [Castanea mollissima]